MKKVTISTIFSILLIFACKKNDNSEPIINEPIDPTQAFIGDYQFMETCTITEWISDVVIEIDDPNPGGSVVDVGPIDTLIINELAYNISISKSTNESNQIIISNFHNTDLNLIANVQRDGKLEIIDYDLNIFRLTGNGQLTDNELIIDFEKEDINGMIERCQIIGVRE